MEDLARLHHLLEPRAAFRRALDWKQQREEALLVDSARVLAQGLAERQMLSLAVRRQPARVGGQEGEGKLLVPAVFGQVEVHPSQEVPDRVQALQEVLDGGLGLGEFG